MPAELMWGVKNREGSFLTTLFGKLAWADRFCAGRFPLDEAQDLVERFRGSRLVQLKGE